MVVYTQKGDGMMNELLLEGYAKYCSERACNVFVYYGSLTSIEIEQLLQLLEQNPPDKPNATIFFATYGGDAHAAYRLVRRISNYFERVRLVVDNFCKSAGTLFAVGCDEIACSDRAEFGPLDVQLLRADELFVRNSGLDTLQAFETVRDNVFPQFEEYMLTLQDRSSGAISTKMASEIAVQLTVGSLQPILSQIDPYRLGEVMRHLRVAEEYGQKLDSVKKSMKPRGLQRLLRNYPAHGCVIDKREAMDIFNTIVDLDEFEKAFLHFLPRTISNETLVVDLRRLEELKGAEDHEGDNFEKTDTDKRADSVTEGFGSQVESGESADTSNSSD